MADGVLKLFTSIGLSEQKAKETLKNEGLAKSLKGIIEEVSILKVLAGFPLLIFKY